MAFKHFLQLDAKDCGPTCLRMVAMHYGKNYTLQELRERCFITREGVSLLGISEASEQIGFRTIGVRISFEQLTEEIQLPCIVHWKQNHFVVVYQITMSKKGFNNQMFSGKDKKGKGRVYIADPAYGLIKYSEKEFLEGWISTQTEGENKGVALLLEPTPNFYENEDEKFDKTKFSFLLKYIKPHKRFFYKLYWECCSEAYCS